MGEYFGRCERCGGTQNVAGDPCFFSNDGGHENTVGTQKIPRGTSMGGLPWGLFWRGVKIKHTNVFVSLKNHGNAGGYKFVPNITS